MYMYICFLSSPLHPILSLSLTYLLPPTHTYPHINIYSCAVAGHSFGSIVAGWAAAAFPQHVQQLILIDPVCLLLCFPDVAVNFLYRPPSSNIIEHTIRGLVDPSSEITVSHALRRHFWWYQNVLWLQDVRCPIVVALSENDDIVPSRAIRTYVERHYGIERQLKEEREDGKIPVCEHDKNSRGDGRVVFWEGLGHGFMLVSLKAQDRLIDAMHEQAWEHGLAKKICEEGQKEFSGRGRRQLSGEERHGMTTRRRKAANSMQGHLVLGA